MQASIILEQMDLDTLHSLKVHKQVWPPLIQGTQGQSMCNSLVADSHLFNGCKGACRPAKVSWRIGAPEGTARGTGSSLSWNRSRTSAWKDSHGSCKEHLTLKLQAVHP